MHWHFIIVRALDLITIIVPPALPATLTIGTSFALSRLRKREIFCISPNRVNVAGTVDVMCFDKTGTLTEEGLDVLGARAVNRETNTYHRTPRCRETDDRFSPLIRDASNLAGGQEGNAAILYTMTTCHSLKLVSDEIIGDALDAKMFEFTGWTFEEGGRIYEFIRDDPSNEEEHKEEDELLENKSESSRGHYVARDAPERSGLPAVRPPQADGKVYPLLRGKELTVGLGIAFTQGLRV